jgi:DNA primase catalytic core
MARIPEDELKRLREEIAVERLAQAYGIDLKPHGANLIGLCPMHTDHEPSFVVTPAKNLWHCLGACQAGGSTIDLVMRMEGLSFRHAVERLRAELGEAGSNGNGNLPAALSAEAADHELLRQVVGYYHATLKQSPEALEYVEKRGLHSSEMIEHFRLGFANRTLTYRLPSGERAKLRERLQELGILRASGHEHFNGCLVIPIFDEHGNVTEIYGRKITEKLRAGSLYHLYLPGPHKGVWNIEALKASKEIILCEALIDALTFWCAGYRNVTASYGVEGFTEDHLAAFQRYGTERVLIAYDRDDAGENAAQKLAEKLSPLGIACYRVYFPRGMDANEYALKVTPAARSLAVLLRSAQWLGGVPATQPAPIALAAKACPEPGPRHEPLDASMPELPALPSPAVEPESASLLAVAPASPVPPAPHFEIPTEVKPEEIVIRLGDRERQEGRCSDSPILRRAGREDGAKGVHLCRALRRGVQRAAAVFFSAARRLA